MKQNWDQKEADEFSTVSDSELNKIIINKVISVIEDSNKLWFTNEESKLISNEVDWLKKNVIQSQRQKPLEVSDISNSDLEKRISSSTPDSKVKQVNPLVKDIKLTANNIEKSTSVDFKWHCVRCSAIVSTTNELKAHYRNTHDQPVVFKCVQCPKVYSRYQSFLRHVKLHSAGKFYQCDVCHKSFSQKKVLLAHTTVHSDYLPHTCKVCGKTFKQFSSLYGHNKNHIQEKSKLYCSLCDKTFATKHTLELHNKVHTGEKNFICDICGKGFIARGSLEYHILTHTNTKPHVCSCGKAFKTLRLLDKHSTLHTGIKPHQCDFCGKNFREKGALREHTRIHTGAMPYTCEFCGKTFRFKGILTVHRRQHTGERPYQCEDCKKAFTNWPNYNKHMKRRHKDVYRPTNVSGRNKYKPPFLVGEIAKCQSNCSGDSSQAQINFNLNDKLLEGLYEEQGNLSKDFEIDGKNFEMLCKGYSVNEFCLDEELEIINSIQRDFIGCKG